MRNRTKHLGALAIFAAAMLLPMLFSIGEERPAYTVTVGLWLFGVFLIAVPAALGYLAGKAEHD